MSPVKSQKILIGQLMFFVPIYLFDDDRLSDLYGNKWCSCKNQESNLEER